MGSKALGLQPANSSTVRTCSAGQYAARVAHPEIGGRVRPNPHQANYAAPVPDPQRWYPPKWVRSESIDVPGTAACSSQNEHGARAG